MCKGPEVGKSGLFEVGKARRKRFLEIIAPNSCYHDKVELLELLWMCFNIFTTSLVVQSKLDGYWS